MKIGLQLSFVDNTLEGNFYLTLFEQYVKFQPQFFRKNYKIRNWVEAKHKKEISHLSIKDSFSIGSKENDLFSANRTGTKKPHTSVSLIQNNDSFSPTNDDIEKLINSHGFVAAYLYNEDYEIVQSTRYSNNYNHKDFDHKILNSINNTPYKINEFNEKEYDIKFNPGRSVLIDYTWLMVGWKMWFGSEFFKLIPKERILQFNHAIEMKKLSDEIIYVQLYDKIEEPYTPESTFKQWKWREWLDYDGLERIYG